MNALLLAALLSTPATGPAAKVAPRLAQDLARGPAEMLVVLDGQADLGPAAFLKTRREKGRFVVDALRRAARRQEPLLAWLSARGLPYRSFTIVNAVWVRADEAAALAIAARPEVLRLEANPAVRGIPPEPPPRLLSPLVVEPGVSQVNAPAVWATGIHGEGIVVADADTGVRFTHDALVNQYRGTIGGTSVHDRNWHDAIHSGGGVCGADSPVPCDDHGHGTHTMGFAVGDDGAGNQIGTAPGAKWIACRNMEQGFGTPARYLECMDFFLAPYPVGGTPADGDPAFAPDIVNNSWVCPPSEGCAISTFDSALAAQEAAGILNVVSAGNSGTSCGTVSDPPAISPYVLTVGALSTGTTAIASFSSVGPVTSDGSNRLKPDVVAPGTFIRSSSSASDSSYSSGSGTSYASPLTAGAAALLLSARPALRRDPARTRGILTASATAIASGSCGTGPVPNAMFGWGLVNAMEAVQLAGPLAFYAVSPCRLVDTRAADAPALGPNSNRTFTLTGACGVPAGARVLALNVTAVNPDGAGALYAGKPGIPMPSASVLSLAPGRVRAGMALVAPDLSGSVTVWCAMDGAAIVGTDLLVDVAGYFQ